MKYKSKLKRNSKYNPHSKRFSYRKAINTDLSRENCEKKIAYLTVNKARKAKRKIEKDGSIMEIYRCPLCKHYHLTSLERGEEE